MNEPPEEHKELVALIDEALSKISEHSDSVQIFVTKKADDGKTDGTFNIHKGQGNWFARYGQVRAWIIKTEGVDGRSWPVEDEDGD